MLGLFVDLSGQAYPGKLWALWCIILSSTAVSYFLEMFVTLVLSIRGRSSIDLGAIVDHSCNLFADVRGRAAAAY